MIGLTGYAFSDILYLPHSPPPPRLTVCAPALLLRDDDLRRIGALEALDGLVEDADGADEDADTDEKVLSLAF